MYNDPYDMVDPDRDLLPKRTYEIAHNKVYLERQDPYGFWYFRLDKGQIPEWMRGAYTTVIDAERALTKYLEERNKTIAGEETHKIKSVKV